jgi:hypothetical protein
MELIKFNFILFCNAKVIIASSSHNGSETQKIIIKFFQHIRYGLINQDKVTKYIFYVFGEILLVVIGILIALQVNNWNEHRINRSEEMNKI